MVLVVLLLFKSFRRNGHSFLIWKQGKFEYIYDSHNCFIGHFVYLYSVQHDDAAYLFIGNTVP